MRSKEDVKVFIGLLFAIGILLLSVSCDSLNDGDFPNTGETIAGYSVAQDSVLRTIPEFTLSKIRSDFEIAYFHTSHGTHVSYGAFGLPGFKNGDENKFGISKSKESNKLYFRDNPGGFSVSDLSNADNDWNKWITEARTWLELPENSGVTVFMWSWCNIAGHNATTYCNSMQTLINEYGIGGTKVGLGRARENPVNFVFMTGHANTNSNTGAGNPKEQASIIRGFCQDKGYYCIDYYSIDTHDMNAVYYEDTGDNGNSVAYGGNFYLDWQNSHIEGIDWYQNRNSPDGSVTYGQHNTQHITANRKAFAFWWVMAKISGWEG